MYVPASPLFVQNTKTQHKIPNEPTQHTHARAREHVKKQTNRNAVEDGEMWASDARDNLQRSVRDAKQRTAEDAHALTQQVWETDFEEPLSHRRAEMEQVSRKLDAPLYLAADPSDPDVAGDALALEKEVRD